MPAPTAPTPGRTPTPARSYLPSSISVLRVLTSTQNCSALVFSVFLGIHLVSPIAAAFGGVTAADRTMLLAREYYLPFEPLVVYTPLIVHLLASTSRRLILYAKTRRRPPLTPHLITGWMLPFVLFPHILSHRIRPSDPASPINSLSPSELGWEYVGWGLIQWPVWSYGSYLALVGIATWHAGVGMMKIVSWLRRSSAKIVEPTGPTAQPSPSSGTTLEQPISTALINNTAPTTPATVGKRFISGRRKLGRRGILLGFLGVIAFGLVRVARESQTVSRIMATRYQAIYTR